MSEPLLILDNIHAAYVKKEILRGISFEVHLGEVVALLGGNGSGKSTTLKVIAGLLAPTKGRIIFRGKDITYTKPRERQHLGIGFLLQGGHIFPNLTVEDNIRVSLSHARNGTNSYAGSSSLGAVFPELTEKRTTRAGLLSGGQRQMLAIEMVVLQQPLLGLFDEPSAALAGKLASSFLVSFSKQIKETGRSLLLIEQNATATAESVARTLLLRDGTVL